MNLAFNNNKNKKYLIKYNIIEKKAYSNIYISLKVIISYLLHFNHITC